MGALLHATGWLLLMVYTFGLATGAPVYDEEQGLVPAGEGDGCYYNFVHYEEGDRILTNEPCLNCTCSNKMLMCYLRVCPFMRAIGQDCTIEKKPDQCCPVVTCPQVPVALLTSTTTTSPSTVTAVGMLDNYGCTLEDNTFYPDGAQVPSHPTRPCELCYCIRNHTACVMQECTLNVDGYKPIYQDGVCCPVRYAFENTEVATTPRPTPGHVAPNGSQTCFGHNGTQYRDGEFMDNFSSNPCERCYCMLGTVVCAVRECGTPMEGSDCEPIEPEEGQCCPSSYKCASGIVPAPTLSEPEYPHYMSNKENEAHLLTDKTADSSASESISSEENENVPEGFGTGENSVGLKPENMDGQDSESPLTPTSDEAASLKPGAVDEVSPTESTEHIHSQEVTSEQPGENHSMQSVTDDKDDTNEQDKVVHGELTEHEMSPTETPVSHGETNLDVLNPTNQEESEGNVEASHVTEEHSTHMPHTETENSSLDSNKNLSPQMHEESSTVGQESSSAEAGPTVVPSTLQPESDSALTTQQTKPSDHLTSNEIPESIPLANEDNSELEPIESARIPGEGSCLVDGKTYAPNTEVPKSNPCHKVCHCINSIVQCEQVKCPSLPPSAVYSNCFPIETPGSCCPTFMCDQKPSDAPEIQNQVSIDKIDMSIDEDGHLSATPQETTSHPFHQGFTESTDQVTAVPEGVDDVPLVHGGESAFHGGSETVAEENKLPQNGQSSAENAEFEDKTEETHLPENTETAGLNENKDQDEVQTEATHKPVEEDTLPDLNNVSEAHTENKNQEPDATEHHHVEEPSSHAVNNNEPDFTQTFENEHVPTDNKESQPQPETISHEEQTALTPTHEDSSPQTEVESHGEHYIPVYDNVESQPELETDHQEPHPTQSSTNEESQTEHEAGNKGTDSTQPPANEESSPEVESHSNQSSDNEESQPQLVLHEEQTTLTPSLEETSQQMEVEGSLLEHSSPASENKFQPEYETENHGEQPTHMSGEDHHPLSEKEGEVTHSTQTASSEPTTVLNEMEGEEHQTVPSYNKEPLPESESDQTQHSQSFDQVEDSHEVHSESSSNGELQPESEKHSEHTVSSHSEPSLPSTEESDVTHSPLAHGIEEIHVGSNDDSASNEETTQQAETESNESYSTLAPLTAEDHHTESERGNPELHSTQSTFHKESESQSEMVNEDVHPTQVTDEKISSETEGFLPEGSHTLHPTEHEEAHTQTEVNNELSTQQPVHGQFQPNTENQESTQPPTHDVSSSSSEVESVEPHLPQDLDSENTHPESHENSQESHTTQPTTNEEPSQVALVESDEQHYSHPSKNDAHLETDEGSQELLLPTTEEESNPVTEVVSHEQHSVHVSDKEETLPESEADQESHSANEESSLQESEGESNEVHPTHLYGEVQHEADKESEGSYPSQPAEMSTPLSEESQMSSTSPTLIEAEHESHPTQSENVNVEDKFEETPSVEPEVSSEQSFDENNLEHHIPEKTAQDTDSHDESLTNSNIKHTGQVSESTEHEHENEVPTTEVPTGNQAHDNAETSHSDTIHYDDMTSSMLPEHPVGEETSSETSLEEHVDVTSEGPAFFDNAHDSNFHDDNVLSASVSTETTLHNEESFEQSEVNSPHTLSQEVEASTDSSEHNGHEESSNVVSSDVSQSESHTDGGESSTQTEQVTSLPDEDHSGSKQTSSEIPALSHNELPENEEVQSSKPSPTLSPEHESDSFHDELTQSKPDESHHEVSSIHQEGEVSVLEHTENPSDIGEGENHQNLPNVEDQAESDHGSQEEQQEILPEVNLDDLHQPSSVNVPEEEMHPLLTEQETSMDDTQEQNVNLHENQEGQTHSNDVNSVPHSELASPNESVDDSETSPSVDKQTVTYVEETKVPEHLPIENQLLESPEPSLGNTVEINVHTTEGEPLDKLDSSPVPPEGEGKPDIPKPVFSEHPSENSEESDRAEVHESQNELDEHKVEDTYSPVPMVPMKEHSQEAESQPETHPMVTENSEHLQEPIHGHVEIHEHTPENEEHHEESKPQHELASEEHVSTFEGQETTETPTESYEKHPDQQKLTHGVDDKLSQTDEPVAIPEELVTPSKEHVSPSDELITPSEEHHLTPTEDVSPSEDHVVPSEEHHFTPSEEEHVTPSEEHVTPPEEHVSSSEEHVSSSEEHAAPTEEHVDSSEEHVAPSEDHVTPSEEHAPPSEEHVTPSEEHAPPSEEHVTSSEEHVAPSEEHVAPSEDHVAPSEDHVTPSEEHGPPSEEHVSSSEEHVAPSEEHVAPSEEHVAPSEEHVSSSEEHVTPSEDHVAPSEDHVAPSEEHVTPSEEHVTPSEEHVVPSEEHVAPSEEHVAPSEEHVTSSEEHVVPVEDHVSSTAEQMVTPFEEQKEGEGETSKFEVPSKDHEQSELYGGNKDEKPSELSEPDELSEHSSETPHEHLNEVQTEEPHFQSHHEETTSDVEENKPEQSVHSVEEMQIGEVTGHDSQTQHPVELPVDSHQVEFHPEHVDEVVPQPEEPVNVEHEQVTNLENQQNEDKTTTQQENTDNVELHQEEQIPLEQDSLGEGLHTESHLPSSTQKPFLSESYNSGPSAGDSDKVEVAPDTHSTETSHISEPSTPPPTMLPSSTEHPHLSEHQTGTHPLFPVWSQKPFEHQTSQPEPHNPEETHYPSGLETDYEEDDGTSYGPGTCRYGGKVYLSAQQIPREDPCDFCFCFRSDVICLQQSCPPPIKGCYQETIKGFCCPRYECHVSTATVLNITTTTTTTTTTLPPHFLAHTYNGAAVKQGCQVKGVAYSVGQRIPSTSGPCLECRCGGNGQMDCDPTLCGPQEALLRQVMDAAAVSKRR